MIKLIGVLIVIIGATFELNLLLTILVATFVTGWVADMESITILEIIGNTFTSCAFRQRASSSSKAPASRIAPGPASQIGRAHV